MLKNLKVLGFIAARGGSKSVPRKNIKFLAGKPLIAWTIEETKKSKYLDRIIVSTEDPEIAEIARRYGAEVPFLRPQKLAEDLVQVPEVILNALEWLEKNERYFVDVVALLPPTGPLRRAEDIDKGIMTLINSPEADSVRPIIESPKHPYKALSLEGEYLKPFFAKEVTGFDEPYDLPRQLFPKAYIYSGAMQIIWTRTLKNLKSLTGNKSKYFLMSPENSVNIDYPLDFEFAEFLIKKQSE